MSHAKDAPLVSVLMTTYRHERYVEQAIRSVLAQQTDFEFEVVIGVDFSEDRTAAVVQEMAQEAGGVIRPNLQESRVGIFQNFSEVYAAARGQIFALLEGDDYWTDSSKLQRQVALLLRHPRMCVCGHYTRVEREGVAEGVIPERPFPDCGSGLSFLGRRCDFHLSSLVFRDRFGRRLPKVLTNPGTRAFDLALKVLLASDAEVGFVPLQMSVFRVLAGSLSSSFEGDRAAWLQAMILALELCRPSLLPAEQKEVDRFLSRLFLAFCVASDARAWTKIWAMVRATTVSPAFARDEVVGYARRRLPAPLRRLAKGVLRCAVGSNR